MFIHRAFLVAVATTIAATNMGSQVPKIPEPNIDYKPTLDSYSSYAWSKKQVPAENMANHLRLINAIQEHMKEHGFRLDTLNPEVRIQYHLELTSRVQGESQQQRSVWDDANATVKIDFHTERAANLSLDFVDAESNFMIWQTKGTYPLGTPDRAEKQINDAVADLFSRFPSK